MTFACPKCTGVLSGNQCAQCGVDYPVIHGVRTLLSDPEMRLFIWRTHAEGALQGFGRIENQIKKALKEKPSDLKRRRLELWLEGLAAQKLWVEDTFRPILSKQFQKYEINQILLRRVPRTQSLLGYMGNLLRDWCWPKTEIDENIDYLEGAVKKALGNGGADLGDVISFGAGSGGLPFEFSKRMRCRSMVITDFNPLLLWSGARVVAGEKLRVADFVRAPRSLEQTVRVLEAQSRGPGNVPVEFVLSDIGEPPFARGSVDTILLPWVIDILPESPRVVLERMNRLLKMGGRFIHFGSLAFVKKDEAENLSKEEFFELAGVAGFEVTGSDLRDLRYLEDPASCQRRSEAIHVIVMKKIREVSADRESSGRSGFRSHLPSWIANVREAVPALKEFSDYQGQQKFLLDVLSKVDGKTSIQQIAGKLKGEAQMEIMIQWLLGDFVESHVQGYKEF